ncbi:cache domain-containing protein [Paenibacillus chondroitinus]|uniref:histidine kinase n=1 Tax=Paenibacillus chondroitinus TaxID=59842 RepID=A0ABU6D8M2_9BACL|nr:sensor histidine kinase [Paenibacillus chondroitinus]MCY9661690.1 histidine kinase [Paenibacillus anseongense]MEB4793775.1 cache domain-containing protein [Paenibacillus chondroitinus]
MLLKTKMHSIKTRMTIGFLLLNLLSLLVVLLISNQGFQKVIEREFVDASNDAASRFSYRMNDYIEQIIQTSAPMPANAQFQAFLRGQSLLPEQTEAIEKEMRKFTAMNHPEIVGMFLMSTNNQMVSMNSFFYSQSSYYWREPWFSLDYDQQIQIIPTHLTNYPQQPRYAVISIVKPVYDTVTMDIIGRFVIDVMPKNIRASFGDVRIGDTGYFFVVSPDDTIIYHPNDDWLGIPRDNTPLSSLQLNEGNETFNQNWNGQNWLISVNKTNRMNWHVVSMVPKSELEVGAKAVERSIIIAFLAVAIIIVTIIPLMTSRFVKPVITLRNLMAKVSTGDLNVRAYLSKQQDEMQSLNVGFNHMVSRLDQLMTTVTNLQMKEMKLELRQKEALIRALQNQINPHLLYNTLGIIKSMAFLENVPRIETISRNLADVYRYTARFENEEVTLHDELKIMAKYLEIVKLRFPMSFIRTISVNEKFYDCLCMKLTLQPIVENAVKYAIEPNGGEGTIIINAFEESGDLILEIADNGKGIPEAQLEDIQDLLRKESESPNGFPSASGSLGLSNVHARLVLRYGHKYGIRIDSFPGQGTVVSIRLPYRRIADTG